MAEKKEITPEAKEAEKTEAAKEEKVENVSPPADSAEAKAETKPPEAPADTPEAKQDAKAEEIPAQSAEPVTESTTTSEADTQEQAKPDDIAILAKQIDEQFRKKQETFSFSFNTKLVIVITIVLGLCLAGLLLLNLTL